MGDGAGGSRVLDSYLNLESTKTCPWEPILTLMLDSYLNLESTKTDYELERRIKALDSYLNLESTKTVTLSH